MEWQTMGSLERRLRACLSGIRAEMLALRLAGISGPRALPRLARAGLPIETPGVRR